MALKQTWVLAAGALTAAFMPWSLAAPPHSAAQDEDAAPSIPWISLRRGGPLTLVWSLSAWRRLGLHGQFIWLATQTRIASAKATLHTMALCTPNKKPAMEAGFMRLPIVVIRTCRLLPDLASRTE